MRQPNTSDIYTQIEQFRNDASTKPTINIAELLKDVSNDQTQHLEGQTIESIGRSIYDSLLLRVSGDMIQPFYEKLTGFRHIDKVYLLHRGKYARWIRNDSAPPKLENGGIVVDTKITDNGVTVLCKIGNRFTQYRFNDCITYQKLTPDEMLVLTAYTALQT
jgi:hypothetical protein